MQPALSTPFISVLIGKKQKGFQSSTSFQNSLEMSLSILTNAHPIRFDIVLKSIKFDLILI